MVRTPKIAQWIWPKRLWRMPVDGDQPTLYLTFDDGPTPGVTDWVLDQLDAFQAQATFFAVGQQAERNPDLLRAVMQRGHAIGSHTQHHLNGWKTASKAYLVDVHAGKSALEQILFGEEDKQLHYFRPPYGRLRSRDAKHLKDQKVVMWDVLAADWRQDLAVDQVVKNVTQNAQNGSIVVFHDSLKAAPQLKSALPKVLEHFSQQGYRFDKLREELISPN